MSLVNLKNSICILFFCLGFSQVFSKPIELSKPEVLLTGWNARCLKHADLNGDGLVDLVYFNLNKSYLEILYRTQQGILPENIRPVRKNRWEPVLEDALYTPERIFVRSRIRAGATGWRDRCG